MSWHERPVLAPVIYGLSTFVMGGLVYATLYLVTGHIRTSVVGCLLMDGILMLYLHESHRVARKEGR